MEISVTPNLNLPPVIVLFLHTEATARQTSGDQQYSLDPQKMQAQMPDLCCLEVTLGPCSQIPAFSEAREMLRNLD